MKNTKTLTFIIIIIIFSLLSIIVLGSKSRKAEPLLSSNEKNEANFPIFFYGNTCPHCEDVEEWIELNKIEEKIKFIKKEVYDNQQNSLELVKIAEKCGVSTNSIGVPFLYAEGKCYVGTPKIINYFTIKVEVL